VIATDEADVGIIGHNMNELVEQIGDFMTAPPRRSAPRRSAHRPYESGPRERHRPTA
jgi:hypothetical protein